AAGGGSDHRWRRSDGVGVGWSGWEAPVGCEEGRGALDFGNVQAEGGVPRSSGARRRGWPRRRWSGEGRGQRLGLGSSCGGKEGCWEFSFGEKGAESVVSRVAGERRRKRWPAALLGTREGQIG